MPELVLRIVTTNDFYGSFFERPTSYGLQPGAASLVSEVSRLRQTPLGSLYVDGGDYAQGGPLAPASGGTEGFTAVRDLGIDVATLGNHEFDWGEEHARTWMHESGFPLVVANYDVGLPPCKVMETDGPAVGVIGLTHPTLYQFNANLKRDQPAIEEIVPDLAAGLRADGADVVVAVMHDGVDWTTTVEGPLNVDTTRMSSLCAALSPHINALIGGHTLGRYVGELAGLPFVQPWAFGAEVGVLDMHGDGTWTASGRMLKQTHDWEGAGSTTNAALREQVHGHLDAPLMVKPWHDISLAEAMARGMSLETGAEISIVFPQQLQTMQSPLDGTFAYLPAGPVTEADVMRVVPFLGNEVCQDVHICEMTTSELQVLLECASGKRETQVDVALSPANWGGPAVVERAGPSSNMVTVAMASLYSERALAHEWLGRELEWSPTGTGLRDALRADVRD